MSATAIPEVLAAKAAALEADLRALGSLMIAYSGGTDSAFLAYVAHRVLGDRSLAVIADSPSLPRQELADALAFCATHSMPVEVLHTAELERADYRRNDARRCFFCKDELFTRMAARQRASGFAHLAYGMNLDDRGEFRPGQQAATQHGALAPLVSAGLAKAEIRELARAAGLALADKPASACLASRIEYGREVTAENLSQVEQAEAALHRMGLRRVRVRHHGELARIEVAREELAQVLDLARFEAITAALKPLGFAFIALDMEGYRSGSMNSVLPLSAIKPALQPAG